MGIIRGWYTPIYSLTIASITLTIHVNMEIMMFYRSNYIITVIVFSRNHIWYTIALQCWVLRGRALVGL